MVAMHKMVTTMSVAQEILSQLGGNRFIAMTGAKSFVGSGDSLTFKLPSGFAKDGINCVVITLTAMDDYIVEYLSIRAGKVKAVAYSDGIYFDTLQKDFTAKTGLHTHL